MTPSLTGIDAIAFEAMAAPSMASDLAEWSDIGLYNVQPDPDFGLSDDEFWTDVSQTTQSNGLPPSGEDDVTELDPVVVIGDGGGGSGGGGTGSGGPGGDGLPGDHDEIDEDPGQLDRPYDACEDRAADTLAQEINDEISRQYDSAWNEYGAFIWRDDDGNLHRTRLVPGNSQFVPFPDDPTELGIDSYSRVVAVIHSHPTIENRGTDESPVWRAVTFGWIHGGDYSEFREFVTNNNIDRNNFSMYISWGGENREYDWSENSNSSLENSVDDEGFVESGDYNPGSTCG